jgi:hypothetical protein
MGFCIRLPQLYLVSMDVYDDYGVGGASQPPKGLQMTHRVRMKLSLTQSE